LNKATTGLGMARAGQLYKPGLTAIRRIRVTGEDTAKGQTVLRETPLHSPYSPSDARRVPLLIEGGRRENRRERKGGAGEVKGGCRQTAV